MFADCMRGFFACGALIVAGCAPVLSPSPAEIVLEDSKGDDARSMTATDMLTPLVLTERQIQADAIEVDVVTVRSMQPVKTVPGKLQYDQRFHVTVRAPIAGLIEEVFVTPGTAVKRGEPLLRLSSPDVGTLKAKLIHAELELKRLQKLVDRDQEVFNGIQKLQAELAKELGTDRVLVVAKELSLGSFRERLVATIVEAQLAQQILTNYGEAATSSVPPRVIQEQSAKVQSSLAALQATWEQSLFEANKPCCSRGGPKKKLA